MLVFSLAALSVRKYLHGEQRLDPDDYRINNNN